MGTVGLLAAWEAVWGLTLPFCCKQHILLLFWKYHQSGLASTRCQWLWPSSCRRPGGQRGGVTGHGVGGQLGQQSCRPA